MHRPFPLLLTVILLAGCAAATPTPPVAPPTESPAPTVEASATATEDPTATPVPSATPDGPTPTPSATARPPRVIGPEDYPVAVNPLTGLVLEDPSVLEERRPLLVKVSNAPPVVRPQSGLTYADLVFEHYAEGGWTRFTALYWSTGTDRIGSVRSVRLIDLQLAAAFDALVVFSGGSNGVIDTIRASEIYPFNVISPQFGYGEPYFRRIPREGLDFEHTMFTDTSYLWGWIDEQQVRTETRHSRPGWAFYPIAPAGGSPAGTVLVEYARTTAEWRFDPVSGQYLRWTDGVAHIDAATGDQLAFENILVLSALHEERLLFEEKYFGEERSWYVELEGEGLVTLFRDGRAYEGRWVREQAGNLITFYNADDEPLLLKPGRTFFQVISSVEGQYATDPESLVLIP